VAEEKEFQENREGDFVSAGVQLELRKKKGGERGLRLWANSLRGDGKNAELSRNGRLGQMANGKGILRLKRRKSQKTFMEALLGLPFVGIGKELNRKGKTGDRGKLVSGKRGKSSGKASTNQRYIHH